MERKSLVVVLALFAVAVVSGCKRKPPPQTDYVPVKHTAYSLDEFSSLCATGELFQAPAYAKKTSATTPSKVAVLRKYDDDTTSGYYKVDEHDFGAIGAKPGDAARVELVACVELKRKGEPSYCSYYGAQVKIYDMTHTVRILEAATGKVLKEETFDLDRRTEKCEATTNGDHFKGTDYTGRVLASLLAFEPEGVALPNVEPYRLDEVCSGSAFPQAAPYAAGPNAVHVVYFPFEARSSTHDDPPAGLRFPDKDKELEVAKIPLVACVTGKPQRKRASCDFTGGKSLEISDGEFEVALMEARTGKLVEKKSFKGSSGGCPDSYKFYGSDDKVMTRIDASFGAWLKKVQSG